MKMQGELSTVKETTKVMDMHPFGPLICSCFIFILFFPKEILIPMIQNFRFFIFYFFGQISDFAN